LSFDDSNLLFTLTDGGTAGIFWGYTVTVIASVFIYLSIGEMASMSPTAGGQYHWVSEFSPPWCQKYLSYITGTAFLGSCRERVPTVRYLLLLQAGS